MKNPSQSTGFVRWHRGQKYAASRPITIPPNTPGFWYVNAVTDPSASRQPTCGTAFDPAGQSSGNCRSTLK
ncbi:hypothetical protein SFUMM280S_06740 [Streptomyces fumanus]